ncbi:MAG: Pyruvate kinase [SAR116 cluster bacterium MED-G04]|jgi:pyruvate kinase|nr:MAG: Pyruvate kinase [SAR116 cluster bacterium MED-G04]|tara:strand:+ start:2264 stop:3685 length:1422 start_codon:yes stop_codon:yes gene_type:complete
MAISSSATRILATLGPATSSPEMIRELVEAGANAFRLNFSHGVKEDHAERYNTIRAVAEETGKPITVLADLQGPKLRIGTVDEDVVLEKGDRFIFDQTGEQGNRSRVTLPHPEIFDAILPGHRMMVNDGKLQFIVRTVDTGIIETEVLVGGKLTDRKGVNVPDVSLDISPLTEKDRADLDFALSLGVDWVALSFVQRVSDIIEARSIIKDRAAIMVKIEKPQALEILEDLIIATDGVMIARGDLGVELPPERIPGAQKDITRICRKVGKPVVVATQMLESMIDNPMPTRAEASDVATAVMDGVDCVMLSAETASGSFPVESVSIMHRILRETEEREGYFDSLQMIWQESHTTYHAVAESATSLARHINAAAVVAFSASGTTAVRLSRERPSLPIVMMTPKQAIRQRMNFLWGMNSILTDQFDSFDEALDGISRLMLENKMGQPGDQVIVVAGTPFGVSGTTNTIRVLNLHKPR